MRYHLNGANLGRERVTLGKRERFDPLVEEKQRFSSGILSPFFRVWMFVKRFQLSTEMQAGWKNLTPVDRADPVRG
jgi:hypothetical protein